MSNKKFSTPSRPLALYGLAANPPHRGHWACVRHLISQGYEVLVVPSFSHAFGKDMNPFEVRIGWLLAAAGDFLPQEFFSIWSIEADLAGEKKFGERIYSIDVLRAVELVYGRRPVLALGGDNFEPSTFSKFKDCDVISSGFGLVLLPEAENVRSTMVRASIAAGDLAHVESWVGASIAPSVIQAFSPAEPMVASRLA